jgi:transcriptional regulator with XRE-family HTH domain
MSAETGVTISQQTLANYEAGTRPCTLERLAHICEALRVQTSTLAALALQRSGLEEHPDVVLTDLHAVIATTAHDLEPLRRWARHRINVDGNDTDGGVARVQRSTVFEMAHLFGCTYEQMFEQLRQFLPERTPRHGPPADVR